MTSAEVSGSTTKGDPLGMSEGVLSKFMYGVPDGDGAVIKSRGLFRYSSTKLEYNAGDIVQVDVASKDMCLDTSRSYFTFKCQLLTAAKAVLVNPGVFTTAEAGFTAATGLTSALACRGLAGNERCLRPAVSQITGVFLDEVAAPAAVAANALPALYNLPYVVGTGGVHTTPLSCAINKEYFRRDGNSQNFIKSMRILTARNQIIEEITDYNQMARTMQLMTTSEDEKINDGIMEGHGNFMYGVSIDVPLPNGGGSKKVSIRGPHNFVTGVAGDAAIGHVLPVDGTSGSSLNTAAGNTYQAALFKLIPKVSGFWNLKQFIPLYLFEAIRFEFSLAASTEVFHGTTVPGGVDGVLATINTIGNYKISEFQLWAELVEPSGAVKMALDDVLTKSGVPLYLNRWSVNQFSNLTNASLSLRVPSRFTHATCALMWAGPTETTAGAIDALSHQHMRLTQYQWKLGTASIPDQPIQVFTDADFAQLDPILYSELRKLIGDNDTVRNYPNYVRWSLVRSDFVASADVAHLVPDMTSYYTVGVSLQTSPGLPGSGTIIGDATDLEFRGRTHATVPLNSGTTIKRIVYIAIGYDTLVMLRPGGLIDSQS